MKTSNLYCILLSTFAIVTTSSCIDTKYDLKENSLNKNMSIFNNGISLPVGSVQEITLDQFIETNDNDNLIKSGDSGYYLSNKGETNVINLDIDDTNIKNDGSSLEKTFKKENIFKEVFSNQYFTSNIIKLPIEANKDLYDEVSFQILNNIPEIRDLDKFELELSEDGEDEITEKFSISIDDVPEEIKTIYKVEFDEFPVRLNLTMDDINRITDRLILDEDFRIEIPSAIILGNNFNLSIEEENGKKYIKLIGDDRVITDLPKQITISVKGVDFGTEGINIEYDPASGTRVLKYEDEFRFHGNAFINTIYKTLEDSIKVPLILNTEKIDTKAKQVKGKFDIESKEESIKINKNDLPDFLNGDNIVIDAAHASIEFIVSVKDKKLPADIPIKAEITTMTNNIENNSVKTSLWIKADQFNRNGDTYYYKYLISDNGEQKEDFNPIIIEDLNSLLYNIPDSIKLKAQIDSEEILNINIEEKTNINMDFAFNVPLEFGKELNISYTDTIDGIHGSLGGIKTTGVKLAGKLEYNIPVNMQLTASAIDTDGNPLDGVNITITPEDKIKTGTHDLSIVITSEDKELIAEKLDGIALEITLTNEDYDENSSDQIKPSDSIYLKDLKISVLGGIEIDADDF